MILEHDEKKGDITMGDIVSFFATSMAIYLARDTALAPHHRITITCMQERYDWVFNYGQQLYIWYVKGCRTNG